MKGAWALTFLMSASGLGPPGLDLGAWITYWDLDRGLARLKAPAGKAVRDVFLFSAALDTDGRVILVDGEDKTASLVSEMKARGSRVWLTVVNDVHPKSGGPGRPVLKDSAVVRRILTDPALAAAHRDEMLALARRLRVSGIDIDYENLSAADREPFTDFIASLSAALRKEEIRLSVTAQPKTRETGSRGGGGLDWRALCGHVDRLQIMLYNLHSAASGPGPMATSEWIESVLRFALGECPPSRIVPVVKLSGMEWSSSGVRGVRYDESTELARRAGVNIARDEKDGTPHFTYRSAGGAATVYFEDAISIERKVRLIESLGFSSVLLWSLGGEDPEILARIGS
jgi:spore germination protein YaaH